MSSMDPTQSSGVSAAPRSRRLKVDQCKISASDMISETCNPCLSTDIPIPLDRLDADRAGHPLNVDPDRRRSARPGTGRISESLSGSAEASLLIIHLWPLGNRRVRNLRPSFWGSSSKIRYVHHHPRLLRIGHSVRHIHTDCTHLPTAVARSRPHLPAPRFAVISVLGVAFYRS